MGVEMGVRIHSNEDFDTSGRRMEDDDCAIGYQEPLVIPSKLHRFQKTLLSASGLN